MRKFLVTVAELIDREKYFKMIADYEKTKQILKEFSDGLQKSADALKKIIDSLTSITDSLSKIRNEYEKLYQATPPKMDRPNAI